ncbi:hypothetical protein PanWU01x14_335740 [Parasponia andersonii]|uniref:Uncharacterized protein n=1 Tax=Parasponia andersonii TaxID=3476 RepID=A0A2P5AG14_PARAD|nr:hypothetical protein PanWU01x14_335740 [Parasponia andersonii]
MINQRSFTIVKQPKTLNYKLPTMVWLSRLTNSQQHRYRDKNNLHQSSNKGDNSSLKISDSSSLLHYFMLNKKIGKQMIIRKAHNIKNTPHTHTPFIDSLL